MSGFWIFSYFFMSGPVDFVLICLPIRQPYSRRYELVISYQRGARHIREAQPGVPSHASLQKWSLAINFSASQASQIWTRQGKIELGLAQTNGQKSEATNKRGITLICITMVSAGDFPHSHRHGHMFFEGGSLIKHIIWELIKDHALGSRLRGWTGPVTRIPGDEPYRIPCWELSTWLSWKIARQTHGPHRNICHFTITSPWAGNKSNWQTKGKTEKSFAHCEWLLWHLFGACNSLDISMLLLLLLLLPLLNA